jgi:hypothetical protein
LCQNHRQWHLRQVSQTPTRVTSQDFSTVRLLKRRGVSKDRTLTRTSCAGWAKGSAIESSCSRERGRGFSLTHVGPTAGDRRSSSHECPWSISQHETLACQTAGDGQGFAPAVARPEAAGKWSDKPGKAPRRGTAADAVTSMHQ